MSEVAAIGPAGQVPGFALAGALVARGDSPSGPLRVGCAARDVGS